MELLLIGVLLVCGLGVSGRNHYHSGGDDLDHYRNYHAKEDIINDVSKLASCEKRRLT